MHVHICSLPHLVRGEGCDSQSEGQGDGSGAGVIAKIAWVGVARGAAHQGGAHDADGERRAMEAVQENLGHALGQEVGVGDPCLVQHKLHLFGTRRVLIRLMDYQSLGMGQCTALKV